MGTAQLVGIVAAVALAMAGNSPAHATTLPAGFEDLVLATGLDLPTAIDFTPDGRMFVAEKAGVVKVVTPGSSPEATMVLDISDQVNSYHDRGLLGLAVAHDFAATGHLYLLYTYELDATRQDGFKTSRLTRVTVGPDNRVRGGERVILGRDGRKPCKRLSNTQDCIPADGASHTVGAVRAPADGTLWLSTGESAFAIKGPHAFHAYRNNSFAGKLIHVDRRGRGLRGHPFCPRDRNLDHVCTKLHAKGFRNPFRFTLRRGVPIVGDVGSEDREEINVALPGENYGWPCYEGFIRTPGLLRSATCRRWFTREGTPRRPSDPLIDYEGKPGGVIVGPVMRGPRWPEAYRGRLFFGDYARGFISSLDVSDGTPAAFANQLGAPVDFERTPAGELAYVDIASGEVRQITWSPGNKAPVARADASRTSGPVPLLVNFSAAAAEDPEGQPLAYHWDFGDGGTAGGREVSHVYARPGNFVVRLTVTDPGGRSAATLLRISPGNTPPDVRLVAPGPDVRYRAGRVLTLRASGRDAEDGNLSGRALGWEATLDHRGHQHFTLSGLKGGVAGFRIPTDHSADSFYILTVTGRDSGGLETSQSVTIKPETAVVRVASRPRGAPVTFAGAAGMAPLTSFETVGFEARVSAARSFRRGGRRYTFTRWSDGRRRVRKVRVPGRGLKLRARYRPASRTRPSAG